MLTNLLHFPSLKYRLTKEVAHKVHRVLLAKAVPAVSPKEITLEEFQSKSGIVSKTTAKYVLEYIVNKGIGISTSNRQYLFSKADKMKLAMLALQRGCDIESISKSISWKDFEALASEILSLCGYLTRTNIRFSKPSRIEIDVIGVNQKLAIVADCKHWRCGNKIQEAVESGQPVPAGTYMMTKPDTKLITISFERKIKKSIWEKKTQSNI